MRFVAFALLAATAGCRGLLGIEEAEVAPADAGPDVADDAPADAAIDASPCTGQLVPICLQQVPTMPLVLGKEPLFDTGESLRCTEIILVDGKELCVVAGTDIVLPALSSLSVRGPRPLVLFATGTIRIDGLLEFSANPSAAACSGGSPPDSTSGGAGGSFGTAGGAGGAPGGGLPAPPIAFTSLRGGCPGQSGGGNTPGGRPGGAVMLLANEIIVSGRINASGGGGNGGNGGIAGAAGGGGGGSGGMILLEAPSLMLLSSSVLIANGGGGGGGASFSSGSTGRVPDPTMPYVPAPGGISGGSGAGGGDGATTGKGSEGGAANGGSGGGGGGSGIIRLRAALTSASGAVCPPPS